MQSGTSIAASPAQQAPGLDLAALVNAVRAAQVGAVSVSHWHALVARGIAPQPVIRRHRMTRWRAADVAQFWTAQATPAQG